MTSMMVSIFALQLLRPVTAAHLDGPIASAAAREAVRIARQPPSRTGGDWSRVVAVPAGTRILVTRTTDSASVGRLLVVADDRGIVLLDLTNPALPKRVARTLASAAVEHRWALVNVLDANDIFDIGDVHLGPDGLSLRGNAPRTLAARDAILTRVPREQVVEVVTSSTHGSAGAAAVAAGGGALIGWFAALLLATACDCSDKPVFAIIGTPVAMASGVYGATRATVTTVVYRAAHRP